MHQKAALAWLQTFWTRSCEQNVGGDENQGHFSRFFTDALDFRTSISIHILTKLCRIWFAARGRQQTQSRHCQRLELFICDSLQTCSHEYPEAELKEKANV